MSHVQLGAAAAASYTSSMLLAGRASAEGTKAYAARFAATANAGHFRLGQGLTVSSIGIGTYLGKPDEADDRAYTDAVERAWESGANVIDTAINYRHQRSERAIGAALARLAESGRMRREDVVVCTKAGFLTPGATPPPGTISQQEIVGGVHCIAPRYLEDQIARSRTNLGLACLDVFYLHNPETQLTAVSRDEFHARMRSAFELLEAKADAGEIQWYGTATWSGYRQPPAARDYLSLGDLVNIARELRGEGHRFRFVQLPFNLLMTEALTGGNQAMDGRRMALLEAAEELGVTVIASASLMQAQLATGLPDIVRKAFSGLETDAQRALQFARSAPGVSVALVGMKNTAHVDENLRLAQSAPATRNDFLRLFQR